MKIAFYTMESKDLWLRFAYALQHSKYSSSELGASRFVLPRAWSAGQQQLGACKKCRVSDPSPDPPNQNLHFNKLSRWFILRFSHGSWLTGVGRFA